jgi:hypothetical protein
LNKIVAENEYETKITRLKQDAAYNKERIRELEDKNRAQEVQLNNQFELIVKLKGIFK